MTEEKLLETIARQEEVIDYLRKELAQRAEQVQQLKAILKQTRTKP
tara:strand:+ start:344 stop:481 length:138 start_codon:yes stop_codon:yes gene_type:complete